MRKDGKVSHGLPNDIDKLKAFFGGKIQSRKRCGDDSDCAHKNQARPQGAWILQARRSYARGPRRLQCPVGHRFPQQRQLHAEGSTIMRPGTSISRRSTPTLALLIRSRTPTVGRTSPFSPRWLRYHQRE